MGHRQDPDVTPDTVSVTPHALRPSAMESCGFVALKSGHQQKHAVSLSNLILTSLAQQLRKQQARGGEGSKIA